MENPVRNESVELVAGRIFSRLDFTSGNGATKSLLAKLRNSAGKEISTTSDIWAEIFSEMPDRFLSISGIATREENAILTALQLYAIHQQGRENSVNTFSSESTEESESGKKIKNLGESLKTLRTGEDTKAVDRRFNAMITSSTFGEMKVHIRHMINLLKASKTDTKINYSKLAQDLFWLQTGRQEQVKLRWGQSFYSRNNSVEERGDKNEN